MVPDNAFAEQDYCSSCYRYRRERVQQTVIHCLNCHSTRCGDCAIDACRKCGWPYCNECRDNHLCSRDSILNIHRNLVCRIEGCNRPQKMGLGLVYCELCNKRECLAESKCISSIRSTRCPCCKGKDACGECASLKVIGSRVEKSGLPNGVQLVTPRPLLGWCCHNFTPMAPPLDIGET